MLRGTALTGGGHPPDGRLAFMLFATTLAHLGAALFHALIRRDGVWQAMALGRVRLLAQVAPWRRE
jgi:cytochrome b561